MTLTNFKLNELLNLNNFVAGVGIPIPFVLYTDYHLSCHEFFDFVLVQPSFRLKLSKLAQQQIA